MPVALPGIGVSRGVAVGKARVLQHGQFEVLEYVLAADDVEAEVARFEHALARARGQLKAIRGRIPADTPEEIAAFIDTHLLMLEDATLATAPIDLIRTRRCNAEWALKLQQDALEKVFDAMDDPYLKTRRDDVAHVVQRVQHLLLHDDGRHDLTEEDGEPRVVIALDLSPSDLLLLHHQQVAAIVTERGGPLSHTAILARNLGIPALMGVKRAYQYLCDDELVVVDGHRGMLLAGLDNAAIAFYRREQRALQRARTALRRFKDRPCVSRDGLPVRLYANIDLPGDLPAVRRVGAVGVGLFRTEFLYMNREAAPGEEEQFRTYRDVVKRLQGLPLTVRTLDLGADKHSSAVFTGASPLGLRAIRLCLKELDLFRAQLRAILRASAFGPVRILLPMLTTPREALQARALIGSCMAELTAEGRPFDERIPVGGMIEVPAAALCADSLARGLDFFSIGTNDLIQYTLAADRIDEAVNHLYDPLNPGVLRLIGMVIEAGEDAGIAVEMCGEMAGDTALTRLLLGMGLTEFSVPPGVLLEVKEAIAGCDVGRLKRQVNRLLHCRHPEQVLELVDQLNTP